MEFKISQGKANLDHAYFVREKVFMGEQGIAEEIEKDSYDNSAYHIIAYDNGNSVGTARLIEKDGIWIIGRVAVLKEYRSKGLGKIIMMKLLDFINSMDIKRVEIHAQISVEKFYEKLGFHKIGEVYLEAEIKHITMIKEIRN